MRRLILAGILLSFASIVGSQEGKSVILYADKIYCEACAAIISKAIRNVPGVSKVSVEVEKKEVAVQFDPAKASVEDLTAATAKRGFPSSVRKVGP
jgi:copper chaperone CopZ